MSKIKSINFKIDREEFEKFLKIINELNKVSETHKIKIDLDHILIYTILGEGQKINVLKSFYIKREKLFANLDNDIKLYFTLIYGKNFYSKFKFLLNYDDVDFNCNIYYDNDNFIVNSFSMNNSILDINCIAGEDSLIKDIDIETKKNIMNTDMSTHSFNISIKMLDDIKKLIKTEKDNDLIYLTINDNILYIGENNWKLKILDNIESKDILYSFQKSYLNSIIPVKDYVTFYLYPTYILVNEHKSQFLFSLELND